MHGPPLAIRHLAVDLGKLKAGGKGKAVHLLHSWKDYLYTMGSKVDPPGVVEIQEVGESKESKGEIAGTSATGEQGRPSVEVQEVEGTKPPVDPVPGPLVQQPRPAPQLSKEGEFHLNPCCDVARAEQRCPPFYAMLYCRQYVVPSNPYQPHHSQYLRACSTRPTSYLTDWHLSAEMYLGWIALQLHQEMISGILMIKDMKLEPLTMSVSASHSVVLSHTPYMSLHDKQLKEEKWEKRDEEERAKVQEMEIKELWKPHTPSGLARFFMEGGFDSSALYTYADLKATVIKYVTARQLVNAHDQSYVNVSQDEVLLSAVAGKNESGDSLEFLKCEEVVQRLSEKMQNWYEIQMEGQEPLLRYMLSVILLKGWCDMSK
ncbi:hypothetical protein EDC04DRAFT_1574615 [Pisolithus marmoratus]|nr:hypothetical protein EDC04DRAFT_1574615 [Pisolithus marmoratus]